MYHNRNDSDSDDVDDEHYMLLNNEVEHLYKSLNICNTATYEGLTYLEIEMAPLFLKLNQTPEIKREVHICAYNINISLQQPFIQYFLHKPYNLQEDSKFKSEFVFPHFQYKNEQDVLMKSMTTIEVLSTSFYKDTQFEFKGYLVDDTDIFMFFDCSHMIIDTLKMTKTNDLWLVTIDEIINHRKVCEFNIHSSVVDLFHKYDKLVYLMDDTGEHYELPIIAYTNCPTKRLDFISTFGTSTCPSGIFGNHYYFTDYFSAIQKFENDQYIGLMRCILFLGKMKIVLNLNNDSVDTSSVVIQNLATPEEDISIRARLKIRITDYDSKWTLSYDSIYVGQIELDDGSILTDGPLWVVKKQNQYHILSSHIIKITPDELKEIKYNTYIT